jgi:hypothetical protein
MSTSPAEGKAFYVIEPGIAPWEDSAPIGDPRWGTVSVCATSLSNLRSLTWRLVSSRPESLRLLFRYHIAPVTEDGSVQKRLLTRRLQSVVPGFGEVLLSTGVNQICVLSELVDETKVELDYLSSYRDTALLEIELGGISQVELGQHLCRIARDLTGASITTLLDHLPSLAVLRLLDCDSHAVAQLMGAADTILRGTRALTACGVRRINQMNAVPAEIARLKD